jgi:mono/diheme cytochrome c family protein
MPRRIRTALIAGAVVALGAGAVACGEEGIQLAKDNPDYEGAVLFQQHCSGCHTLAAAGTQGSTTNPNGSEYVDGPNFNQRQEQKDQILYAIENGGFSSGPMPQDIVVGEEAEKIADFVSKYSGKDRAAETGPGQSVSGAE